MTNPIVTTQWLEAHLADPNLVIADIRWGHSIPNPGFAAFLNGRIPNAIFLDLDKDLSDQSDLSRGRHPLPAPEKFIQTLASVGIGRNSTVIAYDDLTGAYAARLWWMLRWVGHERIALLDGGISKWSAEGRALEHGQPDAPEATLDPVIPIAHPEIIASIADVEQAQSSGAILIDARAPERFRGEVEPIDARAGHIPGAVNIPYINNLTTEASPVFRSSPELRRHFENSGVNPDTQIICYCGSGVTACHNILALEMAGFSQVRLYPGSWSEWIAHHKI